MLCTGLLGCSKSEEQIAVESSIRDYEVRIEEALLMDNGYQDAKFSNVREELDEYLASSRRKYKFKISSPYEGSTLDEALKYYNAKNQTSLTNVTKEEAPKIQEVLEAMEQDKVMTYAEGSCREIEGKYTSQGLSIIGCSYSSSKDKISITVKNNSGVDLRYLEVEIYGIDKNGNTILSDYTNHGSTIRNGASQTLETYVDYAHSYEVEITKATPRY